MLVRMIREIKVPCDRFRCVLIVFLYVTKVFSESVAKSSPCFAEYNFLFYSSNQTASFNPTVFVLSISGDVEANPGPNNNQTRSAVIKCFNCSKTVQSNHKRLWCEKCLTLTHARCVNILPMELKHIRASSPLKWICDNCTLSELP